MRLDELALTLTGCRTWESTPYRESTPYTLPGQYSRTGPGTRGRVRADSELKSA